MTETAPAESTPVLNTVADITAVSLVHGTLPAREHVIARLAALAAVNAPPASYLLNLGTAADLGITLEDAQGILVAVAPIIGTPRTVAAASNITDALGFAIAVAASDLEAYGDD